MGVVYDVLASFTCPRTITFVDYRLGFTHKAIVVAIFAWQWLGGLVLFFTDADISQKGTHAVLGAFAIFGGFLSIITGILTLAFRGDNVADKDYTFKMIAVLTFLLAAAVALVFSSPLP